MSNKCALICETRNLPNLEEVVRAHMKQLPSWELTAVCSPHNKYVFEALGARILEVRESLSAGEYNQIFTGFNLWNQIAREHVLVFQADSMLLKPIPDDMLQYGYIGAPWSFYERGGNGGLSLRRTSAMIDVLNRVTYSPSDGNEDVFFSKHCQSVAPREVCSAFSVETIFTLGTIGYHAIDKYLTAEQCTLIKNQYNWSFLDSEYIEANQKALIDFYNNPRVNAFCTDPILIEHFMKNPKPLTFIERSGKYLITKDLIPLILPISGYFPSWIRNVLNIFKKDINFESDASFEEIKNPIFEHIKTHYTLFGLKK
jgi:hypothetical protein